MREKILVTGGTGLLGYAIQQILPEAVFIGSKDCDLTDQNKTYHFFDSLRPKKVLHLAAIVGGVQKNKLHNADMLEKNIRINTNVLNAARACKVERLISVLSSCAFPRRDEEILIEEDLHEGMPFEGNLGYSFAKRSLDIHTKLLNQQYGCRFSTVTPVTMFGPNDNWDLNDGHVTASLIHKCFLAKRDGRPFEIWGKGDAVRQFIFSSDVARILIQMLDFYDSAGTTILAPNQGISIRELAILIAKVFDFKGELVFDETKPEGQKKRVIQSKAFNEKFPNFQWTPIEEALKKTVSWFENQVCVSDLGRVII